MEELISIVIPVYNVEQYLNKCIESVLKQTYQNFEVILVDDGSTDKSGIICDTFSDSRIKVIHKKNGGLSDARNVGTKYAKGCYITWVDSDDTIHEDYLKILYNLAKNNNADISAGGFYIYEENHEIGIISERYEVEVLRGEEALQRVLKGELRGTSACGMLVANYLAQKFQFPYKKYHEDDFTTFKLYLNAQIVVCTNQPLYYYLQRIGSITHKAFGQGDIDQLDAADYIYDSCRNLGESLENAAFVKKTENYINIMLKFAKLKKIDIKTYNRLEEFYRTNKFRIYKCTNIRRNKKIKLVLRRLGILEVVIYFRRLFNA